jgi:hypothetical protein
MVLNQRILHFLSGYIILLIFLSRKIDASNIQPKTTTSVSPFSMMLKRSSKSLLSKRQLQGDSHTDNLLESPKQNKIEDRIQVDASVSHTDKLLKSPKQKKITDRVQFDASVSLLKRKERLEVNRLSPINRLSPNERIPISWYEQDNVLDLSRRLLGCKLITCRDGVTTAGIITETEAYDGNKF